MKTAQELISKVDEIRVSPSNTTTPLCLFYNTDNGNCKLGCVMVKVDDGGPCPWNGVPANELGDCPCYDPSHGSNVG